MSNHENEMFFDSLKEVSRSTTDRQKRAYSPATKTDIGIFAAVLALSILSLKLRRPIDEIFVASLFAVVAVYWCVQMGSHVKDFLVTSVNQPEGRTFTSVAFVKYILPIAMLPATLGISPDDNPVRLGLPASLVDPVVKSALGVLAFIAASLYLFVRYLLIRRNS